jgi:hypothetical protein
MIALNKGVDTPLNPLFRDVLPGWLVEVLPASPGGGAFVGHYLLSCIVRHNSVVCIICHHVFWLVCYSAKPNVGLCPIDYWIN